MKAPTIQEWLRKKAAGGDSQSPIEEVFLGALRTYGTTLPLREFADYRLKQQANIGDYRADFLFSLGQSADGQPKQLVVELDGHDFHERTKDQARHDKQRDRFMLGKGYALMRFTGSEIHANPFHCVDEVFDRLYQMRYGLSLENSRIAAAISMTRKLLAD